MAQPPAAEEAVVENSLLERAAQGDADAFGQLYDLHVDAVYRHIFYRMGNWDEAEELTAEVFLRAWQSVRRFRPQGYSCRGWLFKIGDNLVIDRFRRRARRPMAESGEADPGPLVEEIVGKSFEQERLRRAMAKLPPDQQQVLILRFVEGMKAKEVAALMKKNEGAIRTMQFRSLKALRALLESEEAYHGKD